MKTLQLSAVTVMLALSWGLSTRAQSTMKQPAPVRAIVAGISDIRSTGGDVPLCRIDLRFMGDAAAYATHVVRVPVQRAEDDLKRNLLKADAVNPPEYLRGRKEGQLQASVYLLNPSRNASAIKILEGTAELFVPTIENGGIIMVTNFHKQPTVPFQTPALKKLGIEVIYLTKATYQSRRTELSRYEGIFSEEWAGPYSKAAARIYVSDTNRLVTSMEIQKADGTLVSPSLRNSRVIDLQELSVNGDKLRMTVFAPGTKRSFPFRLEDVPLP